MRARRRLGVPGSLASLPPGRDGARAGTEGGSPWQAPCQRGAVVGELHFRTPVVFSCASRPVVVSCVGSIRVGTVPPGTYVGSLT